MKLLIVEDDRKLAASTAKNLRAESFTVDHAYDGLECEDLVAVNDYDAILLDIGLPKQDGWITCSHLRESNVVTPILMLTARDDIPDRVKGLDKGADDYLVKPFHMDELVARIRALMRRPPTVKSNKIELFGVSFDLATHRVTRDGQEISLTAREFALLELLMRRPGKIVARDTMMESLWDMNADPRSNVIDASVKLLRRKLDKGFHLPLIHTIRGVGYRFAKEDC